MRLTDKLEEIYEKIFDSINPEDIDKLEVSYKPVFKEKIFELAFDIKQGDKIIKTYETDIPKEDNIEIKELLKYLIQKGINIRPDGKEWRDFIEDVEAHEKEMEQYGTLIDPGREKIKQCVKEIERVRMKYFLLRPKPAAYHGFLE